MNPLLEIAFTLIFTSVALWVYVLISTVVIWFREGGFGNLFHRRGWNITVR